MSLSILFNPRRERKTQIGALKIEATLSENHSASSNITKYTVENASNISDHIVNEPETITIEGFISNTPVQGGPGNYAQEAFDALYEIRDEKELVSVITNYRVYNDMAIQNINIPRTQGTGQAIRFSVELVKVNKAGSTQGLLTGILPTGLQGLARQAGPLANLGRGLSLPAQPAAISGAANVIRSIF